MHLQGCYWKKGMWMRILSGLSSYSWSDPNADKSTSSLPQFYLPIACSLSVIYLCLPCLHPFITITSFPVKGSEREVWKRVKPILWWQLIQPPVANQKPLAGPHPDPSSFGKHLAGMLATLGLKRQLLTAGLITRRFHVSAWMLSLFLSFYHG